MTPIRLRRSIRVASAALVLLGTSAPLPADLVRPVLRAPQTVEAATARHVVVISVDGLRPGAIERFGAGTLQRLMREGSYTLDARTILPSRTLPSHASMLTGAGPQRHGITWNTDESATRGVVEVPTVFGLARDRGLQTAAFFSKTKFHHLETPNSLDHVQSPRGDDDNWSGERTVGNVSAYLAGAKPNLTFVHIADTDYAGHAWGWMNPLSYGRAVRKADAAVATVLEKAEQAFGAGNYTVIVTADHGGSGLSHGSSSDADVTIPWITWGKGVARGTTLPQGIRTVDTAATVLWLLGIPAPLTVEGAPVTAAFSTRSRTE